MFADEEPFDLAMTKPNRSVQFAVSERIDHLDAHTWDALTHNSSVFMRRPFLKAFEAAAPHNVSPRYALMYERHRAIAALVLQVVQFKGRHAIANTMPLGSMAQLMEERAVVLGNLAAWGETGLVVAPGADASLVWSEALKLVDRLRRFEKSEGPVNISFVRDASTFENEKTLRRHGYQRAPSGPDMLMNVNPAWQSFDDYLTSLASKRRRAIRKTFEDLDALGYLTVPLSLEALQAQHTRLDALYGQVWANADVRPLRLSGQFFVELKRNLGGDCSVVGLGRNGRLDAFGVCLRSGSFCTGYYLGFDKTVDAPLYLRLLVAIVEQGIAWKCARISMGRTAEQPKSRLGAVPGGAGLWVKHRTPPVNWAVSAILGSLDHPDLQTNRVFKDTEAQRVAL
jgi:predicted N-acyltransferase